MHNYSPSSTFIPRAMIPPMVAVATSGMDIWTAYPASPLRVAIARNIWGLNFPNFDVGISVPTSNGTMCA